jgi:DNA-binding MarR family transcriptional regulator
MPNKLNVVDLPRIGDRATQRYIDGFGAILKNLGQPPTTGRLLAYLLLMPDAVTLEQAAHDLGASKSSVSVAARQLESGGFIRCIAQRGSRRVLYEAMDSFETILEAQLQWQVLAAEKLRQGVEIAPLGIARDRMTAFADMYQFSIDEGQDMLRRWRQKSLRH